jgi:hypothetical protein
MTPQEQYNTDLEKWTIDITEWQKAQKAWTEATIKLSKNPPPKPGPAPRPPTPPPIDKSKLKNLLGSGNKPIKPLNIPPSGMPRPI